MKCIIPLARGGGFDKGRNRTPYLTVIAGKPLLGYLVDQVLPLKPEEVIFILDEYDRDLIAYVKDEFSFPSRFIMQKHAKGSAHAIYGARKFLDGEILILFGDTFFEADLKGLPAKGVDGVIWTYEVSDPRGLGVVFMDGGYASKLIEKPDDPVSTLAMIGVYYFRDAASLFGAIKHILDHRIMTNGSFQLTDALEYLISKGARLSTRAAKSWVDADHGDGLFLLQRELLRRRGKVLGKVQGSVLRDPVFVDKGASVRDCVLGPNVSVGAGALVEGCVLRDVIVCARAAVKDATLSRSVVGAGASVEGGVRQVDLAPGAKVRLDS
ncbi:hypothetical protein JXA12_00790 [Candidatus Woesearchaeota archaeon]|nr:hypothetical protein [Candidatus Woesearchaeota archaeon]